MKKDPTFKSCLAPKRVRMTSIIMRPPSYLMENTSFHNNGGVGHRRLYQIRALFVTILLLLLQCSSSSKSEAEILIKFKTSLGHRVRLSSWNLRTPPCVKGKANWVGILCDESGVWGLNLENMGLFGTIDVDSLEELPNLRTISLMNNKFNGTFPRLNKMVALKSIYLSGNSFSGEMDPNAFQGMHELKKIHIENNQLSGPIPWSLTTLQKLVELHLEGNKFIGEIPDFKLGILKDLNVSNNQLQGPIPPSLGNIQPSAFSGNGNLCGAPLESSCPTAPVQSMSSSSSSSGTPVKTIIGIVAGVIILLFLIVIIIALYKRRRTKSETTNAGAPVPLPHPHGGGKRGGVPSELDNMEKGARASSGSNRKGGEKITFLRGDVERFELVDLLKASAEVLGSGCFGSSYRAALTTGKVMVVKRFRHMNNVGKEEFQEHMWRIGRLNHPNLLPLVAFYYRKEEKLLVDEYVDNLNLALLLHGNRSQRSPDWPTRLKIIKGVAKGLEYLYTQLPSLLVPHGHLKSSNVLLSPSSLEPLLTDYALIPVVNQDHAQNVMVAYKSPEFKHTGHVTKKTDVWSFGILILEILTGKDGETDLVKWAESVLDQGDWRLSDLFDKEMGEVERDSSQGGQMVKLLKIGLACAEKDVDKRFDLKEAVSRIEEVKESDGNEEFYSVATSDGFEK